MTHSLHREGHVSSLKHDYVIVAKAAKGINESGAKSKLVALISSSLEFGALNVGHGRGGNHLMAEHLTELNELYDSITDTSTITAVFDDFQKFSRFVEFLVAEDSGLSVTLSGLIEKTQACCQQMGINANSLRQSLGIIGNKEKLASDEIREITTMCGHGLIAARLVDKSIKDIQAGTANAKKISLQLSRLCLCGIFNPTRCTELMTAAAKQQVIS